MRRSRTSSTTAACSRQGGGRTIQEAFVAGTEPAREHSNQWSTITSLPWFQQKAFYIPKEGENMPGKKPEGPKEKESPAPAAPEATPALVQPAAPPPPV